MTRIHGRLTAALAAGTLTLALLAAPASAHGPVDRHHHAPGLTSTQRACMAAHGFGRDHADFRRASVRRAFLVALHECGVIGSPAPTTTTTTGPPIIIS